jgi:hypothetical protein
MGDRGLREIDEVCACVPCKPSSRRRNTTSPATQGHDHRLHSLTGQHRHLRDGLGQKSEARLQTPLAGSVPFSHFRSQPLNPSTSTSTSNPCPCAILHTSINKLPNSPSARCKLQAARIWSPACQFANLALSRSPCFLPAQLLMFWARWDGTLTESHAVQY